jgi:hypothetical protein
MDIGNLEMFQRETTERIYKLVDELTLLTGNTDLNMVDFEIKRIRKAIEVETEAILESVKEYHGI